MIMKLYTNTKEPLHLIEIKELKSKNTGQPFKIAAFGNPTTFERFEFFLNDNLDLSGVTPSDKLQLIIEASRSGYNNRYDLHAVKRVI